MSLGFQVENIHPGLGQDETHVYFAYADNSTKLVRAPKCGGSVEIVTSSGFSGVAVLDGYVYGYDATGVGRIPVDADDGEAEPLITATVNSRVFVDSSGIYYLGGSNLWKAGLDGDGPTEIGTVSTSVMNLTADAEHVYWSDGTNFYSLPKNGTASTSPTVITSLSEGYSEQLAVGEGFIFFTDDANSGGTSLWKAPTTGTDVEPTAVAKLFSANPGAVAVDAAGLYFATRNSTSNVYLLPVEATPSDTPTQVATGNRIVSMVMDSTQVYWTNGNGTVSRLAR